jgi:uncharacterized iron-regulated protein
MRSFPFFSNPVQARTCAVLVILSTAATLAGCGPSMRSPAVPPGGEEPCVPRGTWVVPATRQRLTTPDAIDRAVSTDIVLLGEEHDLLAHHLWQLQTIAALHGRRQHVVIGLEMFPRSAQPVLDQWVAGTLDERRFLGEAGWATFWRFPAELYLPIFRFARMNRVPMLALNVSRELVSRVGKEGWEGIPASEREGLSKPAPPTPAYEEWLTQTYRQHVETAQVGGDAPISGFVAAQLLWDRAFAEAIAEAARAQPDALVIGLIGSGHLRHRYGVPHQLASLGIDEVTVFLPWTEPGDCADLVPDLADAVFGVETIQETGSPRPLLGVRIEPADGGVAIRQVSAGSVAAAAGLHEGDVIVEAAGFALHAPGDLQEIVARQAPGTWLPLRVRRGKNDMEIVARFPSVPSHHPSE